LKGSETGHRASGLATRAWSTEFIINHPGAIGLQAPADDGCGCSDQPPLSWRGGRLFDRDHTSRQREERRTASVRSYSTSSSAHRTRHTTRYPPGLGLLDRLRLRKGYWRSFTSYLLTALSVCQGWFHPRSPFVKGKTQSGQLHRGIGLKPRVSTELDSQ